MKKKLLLSLSILFVSAVIAAIVFVIVSGGAQERTVAGYDVQEFNIDDYQFWIDAYQEYRGVNARDYYVGSILTAESAAKTAMFFFDKHLDYNWEGERVSVYYDADARCWLVEGLIPERVARKIEKGKVAVAMELPCMIVKSDGTVLAIWTG